VAFALVVRNGFSVDEDNLKVLLVDPDFALEVTVIFYDDFGPGAEDVGVEFVDLGNVSGGRWASSHFASRLITA